MNRLIEVTTPDPGLPDAPSFSESRTTALRVKHVIETGLAERDAVERAEPRRRELPERIQNALSAMIGCVDGMQDLEGKKSDLETAARNEGFVVDTEGCVGIGPQHKLLGEFSDDSGRRHAQHQHRMMSALAEMLQLQKHTVANIRERSGADLEVGAQLPPSPLLELMKRLASDAARTTWQFGPNPPNTAR